MPRTERMPLLTIEAVGERDERVTKVMLRFGPDRHYDLSILVDPAITPDSVRRDGMYRPGAHLRLGGLDDAADAAETTVFRAFGESELRFVAKACLAAATRLRQLERSQSRRSR